MVAVMVFVMVCREVSNVNQGEGEEEESVGKEGWTLK
jgi:hypothetical protein